MSIYGVSAALLAIGALLFNIRTILSSAVPPLLVILFVVAVGGGLITLLCRVKLPKIARIGLIAPIIITMITVTARGDLFQSKTVGQSLDTANHAIGLPDPAIPTEASRANAASDDGSDPAQAGSTAHGASVKFEPAASGDQGWAGRLSQALNLRYGGKEAQAFLVHGTVSAEPISGGFSLVVNWSITVSNVSASCGKTSVFGRDARLLIDQLGQPISSAVARSASEHRALCP